MAQQIGYQDGITAFFDWYRKQPGVPKRGPGYDPNDLSTWPWVDKMERTLRILKDDHDALLGATPKPPPKPDNSVPVPVDPSESGYAPQSYNPGSRGQNAKFNIRVNCTAQGNGFVDRNGIAYDDSGLCQGGRTEPTIPGLKPSDMSDGKEPWEPYEYLGNNFPPYPAQSYEK